jgi:hypothetical protein
MIAWASGLGVGEGRFSRPQSGVGVLAMPDAGLDTMRRMESVCKISLGAGVLGLLVPGLAVGVFIDHRSAADGVEVMH